MIGGWFAEGVEGGGGQYGGTHGSRSSDALALHLNANHP